MYRWYISIDVNGTEKVVRSNAGSYDDAKKEIEELYPGSKIMGYVETKRRFWKNNFEWLFDLDLDSYYLIQPYEYNKKISKNNSPRIERKIYNTDTIRIS